MIDQAEYDRLWQWGKDYVNARCIERRDRAHAMPALAPGKTYTWMFLPRRGLYNPEFLRAVVQMFEFRIAKVIGNFNFQLAGVESAATPIIVGCQLLLGLPGFSVRKDQKTYGIKNWVEGVPKSGIPVLLVDDLCNSSKSLRHGYDVCKIEKLPILTWAFVLINKVNKQVHSEHRRLSDMYLPPEIKVIYLWDLDDFNLAHPSH